MTHGIGFLLVPYKGNSAPARDFHYGLLIQRLSPPGSSDSVAGVTE